MIGQLFEKVRREHSKQFMDGCMLQPGTVIRADSQDPGDPTQPQRFANFIACPYFAVKEPSPRDHTAHDGLYPLKSLLQTFYQYESTHQRDEQQAFSEHYEKEGKKIMCVPQLWVVFTGSCTSSLPARSIVLNEVRYTYLRADRNFAFDQTLHHYSVCIRCTEGPFSCMHSR